MLVIGRMLGGALLVELIYQRNPARRQFLYPLDKSATTPYNAVFFGETAGNGPGVLVQHLSSRL